MNQAESAGLAMVVIGFILVGYGSVVGLETYPPETVSHWVIVYTFDMSLLETRLSTNPQGTYVVTWSQVLAAAETNRNYNSYIEHNVFAPTQSNPKTFKVDVIYHIPVGDTRETVRPNVYYFGENTASDVRYAASCTGVTLMEWIATCLDSTTTTTTTTTTGCTGWTCYYLPNFPNWASIFGIAMIMCGMCMSVLGRRR